MGLVFVLQQGVVCNMLVLYIDGDMVIDIYTFYPCMVEWDMTCMGITYIKSALLQSFITSFGPTLLVAQLCSFSFCNSYDLVLLLTP